MKTNQIIVTISVEETGEVLDIIKGREIDEEIRNDGLDYGDEKTLLGCIKFEFIQRVTDEINRLHKIK